MRVLLDEQLPVDLAEVLSGHSVDTVVSRGWAGIKNGDLLQRQNLSGLPFGVLLLRAPSNRIVHLRPLVLTILDVLSQLSPGQLRRIGV